MKLTDFAIKHPAIIIIVTLTLTIFGAIAYTSLSSQFLPDISQPRALVLTVYPGVSAERVHDEVTHILEDALVTIPGVIGMTGESLDSFSMINLEFEEDEDINSLLPVIREKINIISDDLPDNIQGAPEIHVNSVATYLPIYSFMLNSSSDLFDLTNYVNDEVVPALSGISDISKITLTGGRNRQVVIELHLEQLEAKGISVLSIMQILKNSNVSLPSGSESYQTRDVNIRTDGEYSSLKELGDTVVGYKDNGFIFLKDVASLSVQGEEPDQYTLSDGTDALYVEVYRREGSDTVKIIEEVNNILSALEEESRQSVQFITLKDDSSVTKNSIASVVQSAAIGTILAVFVIFLFLHNVRATLIIGLTIPLSVILAFIGFNLGNITLNILSLSGITVALGMLVDPAIVVLENTSRYLKKGMTPVKAAATGAGEVGSAIIASTSTSLAVFAPLLMLTGIIGIFLGGIAKTLIFALSASVFVALLVTPFLSSRLLKEKTPGPVTLRIRQTMEKLMSRLDSGYQHLLEKALIYKRFVLFFSLAVLVISVIALSFMGTTFIPPIDSGEFEIQVSLPEGYGIDKSRQKALQIEEIIRAEIPEIESDLLIAESSSIWGLFRLRPKAERERSVFDIIDYLQPLLSSTITDTDIRVQNAGIDSILALSTGGQGFVLSVRGNTLEDAMQAGQMIESVMKQDPEVISTDMNIQLNRIEIVNDLMLDRLGSLGITAYEAALTNRILFTGETIGKLILSDGNDSDILLISDIHGEPVSLSTFEQISLVTPSEQVVSLGAFSATNTEPTLDRINREDRQYSVTVSALLTTRETGGITGRISDSLNNIEFPEGINWEIKGAAGEWASSMDSMILVFAISVFLVYAVMVIQFERFLQPLIIMGSIPFCLIGVVFSLKIFGSPMSLIPFLALIALGGIVVNNAIVLIDYINTLRRRDGVPLRQAIVMGGRSRIQPILMTTLTTMLGVLPMALGRGEGADLYAPLGQAIFGGLMTSTIITLLLIPVLYYIIEQKREKTALSDHPDSDALSVTSGNNTDNLIETRNVREENL